MTWDEELARLDRRGTHRRWFRPALGVALGVMVLVLLGVVAVQAGWAPQRSGPGPGPDAAPTGKPVVTGPSTRPGTGPISLGFYPGWVDYAPDEVDYSPWTHIGHFGIYPDPDGGLRFGDLAPADLDPAVTAAHGAGVEILLVIGSEGTREAFLGATSDRNRPGFVDEIVTLATRHGYDGVDIAWSDEVDPDQFTALILDLRAAIDDTAPHLLLTFEAVSGLLPPALAAELHPYVDYIHLMSFWSDGSDELTAYTRAGVPAGKLTVGVGLYQDGYHDTTPERVREKVELVRAEGAAGVMAWSFQHLDGGWNDPRLEPLRSYVAESGPSGP